MNNPGIRAEGVWKKFRRGELHDSLRDLISMTAKRAVTRPAAEKSTPGDFWALKDVSFEVLPGQALGVIGPNGAGKSTLLKLLTRILRPTKGTCSVTGRVGALIEIAAGFHPDLTGRENVYLQGAIMGMRRAEIDKSFDEIVEFAGVQDFIQTPVKRYSSGMNARLGFAIAAHLRPDVLIIDEVLAVGDFQFQERAFSRISSVVKEGIPVVVVSHQLDRIAQMCTDAILLDRGAVIEMGTPAQCIQSYVMSGARNSPSDSPHPINIESVSVVGTGEVESGTTMGLVVAGKVNGSSGSHEVIEIRVRALQTGQLIYATSNDRSNIELPQSGPFKLETQLQMNLPLGVYAIETVIYDQRKQRVAAQGPFCTVQVQGGPTFWGTVQLNASMQLGAVAQPRVPALHVS